MTGATVTLESLVTGAFGVRERAAVYRIVAAADLDTLESLAVEASGLERTPVRAFALDVILARMTEIDPQAGIDLARDGSLDADQVLMVALGALESLGVSETNIGSVLSALPALDGRRFRREAFARLAAANPRLAFETALATRDPDLRAAALERVASVWVERDAEAALAAAGRITDGRERLAYRTGALGRLAETDPVAALTLIPDIGGAPLAQAALMQIVGRVIATLEPRRALELSERISGPFRQTARMLALHQWGRDDPLGALEHAQALPPGQERQQLMQAIAAGYGRQDPDAALAWVETLEPAAPGLYGSVLSGIAEVDARRAIDLALDAAGPTDGFGGRPGLFGVIINAAGSGELGYHEIAERVLAADGSGRARDGSLQMLASVWAQRDPESAFDWAVNNAERAGYEMLRQVAQQIAQQDPAAASRYTDRVPADLRGAWITEVARGYAQRDPAGAEAWIARYRGQPGYDAGVATIAPIAAGRDPRAAANLVQTMAPSSPERVNAARAVASQWAGRNFAASRSWAAALRPDAVRDAALAGVLAAGGRAPDAATLALFSSERARQEGVLGAIYASARSDPAEARALVEQHISDADLRSQAERVIESIESGPSAGAFRVVGGSAR